MVNLQNILNFIKLTDKKNSVMNFEKTAKLSNGTINGNLKANKDLSIENISKVVKVYGESLKQQGFHIINMKPLGIEQILIVTPEQVEEIRDFFILHSPLPLAAREFSVPVSSEQPDLSPVQLQALLFGEIKELVKATQEIAQNTRPARDVTADIEEVNLNLNKDIVDEKGRNNKPG